MKAKKQSSVFKLMIAGILCGLVYRNLGLIRYFNLSVLESIGIIFINLIKGTVPILIFFSIASSILSLKNLQKAKKMVNISLITFLLMTISSIVISIAVTSFIEPGKNIDVSKIVKSQKMIDMSNDIVKSHMKKTSIMDFIVDIFPTNIIKDLAEGNFMHIIMFSGILAVAILQIEEKSGIKKISSSIKECENVMMQVTEIIMKLSPLVIFSLSFWLVGYQDLSVIKSLLKLIISVLISGFLVVYVSYSLVSIFVLKLNPVVFFKKILPSQVMGFVLSSSSSVLPLTMKICKEKLGISDQKTEFVIPLGATINMNGAAIYFAATAVFTAQFFKIDLCLQQYMLLIFIATVSAIGTAPVPGSSMALTGTVLLTLGLPIETLPFFIAIERIVDSIRTSINISGDAFSALVVDKLDGTLDKKIYKNS